MLTREFSNELEAGGGVVNGSMKTFPCALEILALAI